MAFPFSDRPDAQLVREVLSGDLQAFNALVRRWERKVYSYLVYLTGRPEDALDLCQEVFVSAYTNLERLRAPERFRQWVFQIAHNTAYSHLRGTLAEAALPDAADPPGDEVRLNDGSVWGKGELKVLVERALEALPVEQREAIVLKFYQGFKFSEIAEIQNCPVSTIKTRVYTGFEQLKKLLQP